MLADIIKTTIWCFAILVSVTSGAKNFADESVVRNARDTSDSTLLPYGGTAEQLLDTSDGFLAGEDTPVWYTRSRPGKPVSFVRNRAQQPIKAAIEYWKSTHLINRGRRSTDGFANFTLEGTKNFWKSRRSINRKRRSSDSTTSERTTDAEVLYPTVLAVLDYGSSAPTDPEKRQKWLNEGILYALAFWNSVDLQLRYIESPAVRIRLAGIVLTSSDAVPYIRDYEKNGCFNVVDAVVPMMTYWKRLARSDPDFNLNAYDTVATMTRTATCSKYSSYTDRTAADTRRVCAGKQKRINGFIVHDNLSFGGIQPAVHSMARILGAKVGGSCPLLKDVDVMETPKGRFNGGYGRTWSACTLEEISNNLFEHGWCMEKPKENFAPGKPVQLILPGQVMSIKEQCEEIIGEAPYDCFKHMKDSPCTQLVCTADTYKYAPCAEIGQFVPDGSTCDVGFSGNGKKICLDGKCVKDPTLVSQ